MTRLAIIDYEAGNLTSVERAVRRLGHQAEITRDPDRILSAERVIFPGVGAAGSAMNSLKRQGLAEVLAEVFHQGRPLLGICLGTQIIFEYSDEDHGTPCLGLLPGRVRRFPPDLSRDGVRLKVPHMGWNGLHLVRNHPVLEGLTPEQEFYFVHAYYPEPAGEENVLARTDYGVTFASILARGSLIATQFHLEKSGRPGLNILDNFCRWDGRNA
ncbi:MAG: imidazole glycerol phosphate synthase subunit HisH [Thermodesulfobacteriota bacterium]